ncbi:MAG: hypothetical protein QXJ59_04495 [Thermofilaceae archaeon]
MRGLGSRRFAGTVEGLARLRVGEEFVIPATRLRERAGAFTRVGKKIAGVPDVLDQLEAWLWREIRERGLRGFDVGVEQTRWQCSSEGEGLFTCALDFKFQVFDSGTGSLKARGVGSASLECRVRGDVANDPEHAAVCTFLKLRGQITEKRF